MERGVPFPADYRGLGNFVTARRAVVATVCLISSSIDTAAANVSLAFRLGSPQKFRYGVARLQKVPAWRSVAFWLSLSRRLGVETLTCL